MISHGVEISIAGGGADEKDGRLLGSMPAIHPYKVHPQRAIINELTGRNRLLKIPELDDRFLHNHCSDLGPHCGKLFGSTSATRWYKECFCNMIAHEVNNPCGSCVARYRGYHKAQWQIPLSPLDQP